MVYKYFGLCNETSVVFHESGNKLVDFGEFKMRSTSLKVATLLRVFLNRGNGSGHSTSLHALVSHLLGCNASLTENS
jgi:hypothetical protein